MKTIRLRIVFLFSLINLSLGMNTVNPLNILHTEEIKKKYSTVEREIKRQLTEIILLNNI
jgi:hypothetical protein